MTFDLEFKKALQLLSDKEKDKLILRLLKNDLQLANRLHFELVDTDSVQDKREQVRTRIIKRIQIATDNQYSSVYLLKCIREISGEINEHVFITKDKLGEIILNCLMLRILLELNNERISLETQDKSYALYIYIVARIFKILILIQKQHEDFHMDFREDIEVIGKTIGSNHTLMKIAIRNGMDVNWLIQFNIPEDISGIYKKLRINGFLR